MADAADTYSRRKGLDYLIDRGVRAIETEHRQQMTRQIALLIQMGEALADAHAALRHHPGGDTRDEPCISAAQAAVGAFNDYRAD